MVDSDQLDHYETRAAQWYRWQNNAREYVCAANVLLDWYEPILNDDKRPYDEEKCYSSFAPMMLLYAAAAENLLKAIRIAQGTPATQNGLINPYLKSHGLEGFARDAGISLTKNEQHLLRQLQDSLEAGKYPIATAPEKSHRAYMFSYPCDLDRVWSMLERLEMVLSETGKPTLPKVNLRRLCRRHKPGEVSPNSVSGLLRQEDL
jgi:hypothetical protein